jgi:hypothetical protein
MLDDGLYTGYAIEQTGSIVSASIYCYTVEVTYYLIS